MVVSTILQRLSDEGITGLVVFIRRVV
jgi:hypothetical protein